MYPTRRFYKYSDTQTAPLVLSVRDFFKNFSGEWFNLKILPLLLFYQIKLICQFIKLEDIFVTMVSVMVCRLTTKRLADV